VEETDLNFANLLFLVRNNNAAAYLAMISKRERAGREIGAAQGFKETALATLSRKPVVLAERQAENPGVSRHRDRERVVNRIP
jgi:hypothetical protein